MITMNPKGTEDVANFSCVLDLENSDYCVLRDKLRSLFSIIWNWVLNDGLIVDIEVKVKDKETK